MDDIHRGSKEDLQESCDSPMAGRRGKNGNDVVLTGYLISCLFVIVQKTYKAEQSKPGSSTHDSHSKRQPRD